MDNSSNYSVLIHCRHGTGRAEMYAALYRIDYENFTNKKARQGLRTLVKFSSFNNETPKDKCLKGYKSRKELAAKKNNVIERFFCFFRGKRYPKSQYDRIIK